MLNFTISNPRQLNFSSDVMKCAISTQITRLSNQPFTLSDPWEFKKPNTTY